MSRLHILVIPAVALLIPGCDGTRTDSAAAGQQAQCQPGAAPTHPYPERPEEPSLRYGTRPVVIGCVTVSRSRTFELVAYQLGRAADTELCIDHYDPTTREIWGCGSDQVLGGPSIDATATHRRPGRRDVVAGALSTEVARVVVRMEVGRRLRQKDAPRLTVRRLGLLRAIGADRAFGRYLAELPAGARAVTAEALDARGRSLGLAFAEGVPGPVGEGRKCYSRPRITGLRLLDPAVAGARSRLRVAVGHPGGYLRSVVATVSGKQRFRRAFERRRGRLTTTLPVELPQPGTIGIDVTAAGLPLSENCGGSGFTRRSATKTLVVRVRER